MILNILKWIVVAVVFLGAIMSAVFILAAKALDMEMEREEEEAEALYWRLHEESEV